MDMSRMGASVASTGAALLGLAVTSESWEKDWPVITNAQSVDIFAVSYHRYGIC